MDVTDIDVQDLQALVHKGHRLGIVWNEYREELPVEYYFLFFADKRIMICVGCSSRLTDPFAILGKSFPSLYFFDHLKDPKGKPLPGVSSLNQIILRKLYPRDYIKNLNESNFDSLRKDMEALTKKLDEEVKEMKAEKSVDNDTIIVGEPDIYFEKEVPTEKKSVGDQTEIQKLIDDVVKNKKVLSVEDTEKLIKYINE